MRTGTAAASPVSSLSLVGAPGSGCAEPSAGPARPAPAAPRPAGPELHAGDVILGRYELVRILGRGGAGTVWKADDRELGRPVAIKCLPHDSDDVGLREARAAARLGHPAVVTTYGIGRADGCAWLVTEFVGGITLRQTIVEDTHDDDELLQIGVAICAALEHAHRRGIVHRDVTPRNILVPSNAFSGTDPTRPCHPGVAPAKLADFGIARLKESLAPDPDPTRIVGTLSYMAPERLAGSVGDEASDLWAVGVVLHEALVGEHPAGKPDKASALVRTHAELPSLGRRRPDLPAGVVAAIDRACAAEPSARGTVAELARALTDGLTERHVALAPVLRDPLREIADGRAPRSDPRAERRFGKPVYLGFAPLAAGLGAALGAPAAFALGLAAFAVLLVAVGGSGVAGGTAGRKAAGAVVLAVITGAAGLIAALASATLGVPASGPALPVAACLTTIVVGGCLGRSGLARSIR